MFGAIYGDIIGSYYELHCTKNYNFPFRNECTFTDDSVMTAAVCKTILDNPCDISFLGIKRRAFEFAAKYRQFYSWFPNAGFGQMFSTWAKDYTSPFSKSYANGGAMRVVPIGWAYASFEQVMLQAKASCLPSHNNKEAIQYAQCVAAAVFLARNGESKENIRKQLEKRFKINLSVNLSDLRERHIFDCRASYSIPAAIVAFLWSDDYESAVRNAVSLGGDADTEACISGGIAEAFYGEIPENIRKFCYPRLDISLKNVVNEFYEKYKK